MQKTWHNNIIIAPKIISHITRLGKSYHTLAFGRWSHAGNIRSEKSDARAKVVVARKKKNACFFLGVGSKQGRLDHSCQFSKMMCT